MQMTRSQWLMLIILSVLWGGTYFTGKIALAHFTPFALLFWRIVIATLFLGLLVKITKTPLPFDKKSWQAFLGMCLLNNILPMSFIFFGLNGLSSSLASILNATTPIFTVLVMHFSTKDEKITLNRGFGVLLGFLGVVVLMGVEGEAKSLFYILCCLGAALSYGFSGLYGRRFVKMQIAPMSVAFGQLACSSVIMVVINLIFQTNVLFAPPNLHIYLATFTLGVFCTGVAYILFFKILQSAGATNIMLVTFLIPISSIFMGVLFLKETLLISHIFGMILIGLGLAAIDGRVLQFFKK
jgi:drug/metabolite transporter (DMT)-like permease